MKVEVIEFYPRVARGKRKEKLGTFHVYLPELDIDIRGVTVFQKKDKVFIGRPHSSEINAETGERVNFPIICFANMEKDKDLKRALKKACEDYLNKNFRDLLTEKAVKRKPGSKKISGL